VFTKKFINKIHCLVFSDKENVCYVSSGDFVYKIRLSDYEMLEERFFAKEYDVTKLYCKHGRLAMGCTDRKVRITRKSDMMIHAEFVGNTKKIQKLMFSNDG